MSSNIDIVSHLKKERLATGKAIQNFFDGKKQLFSDYPQEFQNMFHRLGEYSLNKGKMARPMLVRLAYQMFTDHIEEENIVSGSAAIELLHRYLLIHDDLVDRDLLRHGKPGFEKQYDSYFSQTFPNIDQPSMYDKGMAIIAGDLLNSFSYELITESGFSPEIIVQTIKTFNLCLAETAAGWAIETDSKYMKVAEVSEERIFEAMRLVSAQYSVVWPLRIGQIYAGVNPDKYNQGLETYGVNIGLAFQIQDDILAIFGEQETTGKPVGRDITEGKKSLIYHYAYKMGSDVEKVYLEEIMRQPLETIDLDKVKSIIVNTGALDQVKQISKNLVYKGLSGLKDDSLTTHTAQVSLLKGLAEFLAEREY